MGLGVGVGVVKGRIRVALTSRRRTRTGRRRSCRGLSSRPRTSTGGSRCRSSRARRGSARRPTRARGSGRWTGRRSGPGTAPSRTAGRTTPRHTRTARARSGRARGSPARRRPQSNLRPAGTGGTRKFPRRSGPGPSICWGTPPPPPPPPLGRAAARRPAAAASALRPSLLEAVAMARARRSSRHPRIRGGTRTLQLGTCRAPSSGAGTRPPRRPHPPSPLDRRTKTRANTPPGPRTSVRRRSGGTRPPWPPPRRPGCRLAQR